MPNEMPSLMATSYAAANTVFGGIANGGAFETFKAWEQPKDDASKRLAAILVANAAINKPKEADMSEKRRLVRVLMVDPNDDVPVESALLYDSKEVFTDKTDQELYFDIPVVDILKAHNEKRTKLVNKAVKDRTEYLEPARIRDLKMLVIALATF